MKHLDFTIDFETCSMSANAAVMQAAIVPWLRDAQDDPLSPDGLWPDTYTGHVDLRTCVVDGFDFDPATIKWWAERSAAAKEAVTDGFAEPISDVLITMLDYVRDVVAEFQLESICLWCQGMDFDVAILRNLCRKYDVDLENIIPHTSFRDCRTLIMEAALIEAERSLDGSGHHANGIALPHQILTNPSLVYKMFEPLPEKYAAASEAHDALYDALRSSWNTWQALKWLRGL